MLIIYYIFKKIKILHDKSYEGNKQKISKFSNKIRK